MSYLPVLKGKSQNKFTNPLTGFFYDNKKYAESCIEPELIEPVMPHKDSAKSKSIPHSFFKQAVNKPIAFNKSNQLLAPDKEFRLTKIMSLSKRLSDHTKFRCTRNKWLSEDEVMNVQQLTKTKLIEQKSIKQTRDIEIKAFRFPEIQALILNLFYSTNDSNKACKVNLKNYFQLFFKQTLSGIIFRELIDLVEKYIQEIVQTSPRTETQSIQIEKEDLDNEYANILSKGELYSNLKDLEGAGKTAQIIKIVKAYCLPSKQIRGVFMQDVLGLISIQLYETFNCNKNNQYVLLKENGQLINDFAQIGFSTTNLFISEKSKHQEHYERYLQLIQNNSRLRNRFQFREILKLNFREKVAKGNFDDGSPSPQRSVREEINEKRNNLNRAQGIVNTKNANNASRVKLKDFKNMTADCSRENASKSKSKDKVNRMREAKVESSHYSIDKKIENEFKILKNQNDFINTILKNDQSSRNKIEIQILVKESVYFKNKTPQQIDRILSALNFISRDEEYQSYYKKLISHQQYAIMRKIIDCIGEREHSIRFIDRYLDYDDYGELEKDHFRQILAFIVGSQGKTADIILRTIWNWLLKNGVISNTSIRRTNMQIMYERNKLVYYFLISLIFGTNEVSVLDLTQEILV